MRLPGIVPAISLAIVLERYNGWNDSSRPGPTTRDSPASSCSAPANTPRRFPTSIKCSRDTIRDVEILNKRGICYLRTEQA